MNCRNFERAFNELLDADASAGRPGAGAAATELALLEHAAACPRCRLVAARFEMLRRAIQQWGPPPMPSTRLADQTLSEIGTKAPSPWAVAAAKKYERRWPIVAGLVSVGVVAAAIAIAIAPILGLNKRGMRVDRVALPNLARAGNPHGAGSEAGAGVVDAVAFNSALLDATEATWDLARSASEPAARIGRQFLGATLEHEQSPGKVDAMNDREPVIRAVSVPSLNSLTPDATAAGILLQQVGDRLATGVRPLSDTARHAFGFLLGPALSKPDVPINPPAQKKA